VPLSNKQIRLSTRVRVEKGRDEVEAEGLEGSSGKGGVGYVVGMQDR